MGTQFSVTVFALVWGVPYLTVAQGLSPGVAGVLLTISVVAAISSGIVVGIFTGQLPHRRSRLVLGIIGANALAWTVVLVLPSRAPLWLLVALVVVISVGGPGSMVGFDFARTFNPSATLGTAQGMVNMGGFVASLLVMQAMGLILDAAGDFSFASFRLAWTVQYAIWIFAVVGILITRHKARRLMRVELGAAPALGGERMLLEGFDAASATRCARWPSPYSFTAASWALANVRCALAGDFCSVLGRSLFLAVPPFVVFGIVVLLHRKARRNRQSPPDAHAWPLA